MFLESIELAEEVTSELRSRLEPLFFFLMPDATDFISLTIFTSFFCSTSANSLAFSAINLSSRSSVFVFLGVFFTFVSGFLRDLVLTYNLPPSLPPSDEKSESLLILSELSLLGSSLSLLLSDDSSEEDEESSYYDEFRHLSF